MKLIYFLKTRTAIVILIIMAIICTGALVVAGEMTVVAYKKQSQEIGSPHVINGSNTEHIKSKLPNLKTIQEIPLYFNGSSLTGLKAYNTSKGELLIPIDDIFNLIKVEYTYHTADGIVEANYKGDEIILKIWSDEFTINGHKKTLPYGVILSNDRIMVPPDVLNYIKGFSASGKAYLSVAYVNYNPDFNMHDYKNVNYITETNGTEGVYRIDGEQKVAIDNNTGSSYFLYSSKQRSVLYTENGATKLLTEDIDTPVTLSMGEMAQWSEDKMSIFETADNYNTFRIYDFKEQNVKNFKNVRETISNTKGFSDFSNGMLNLVSYWSDGWTTCLKVRNTKNENVCTVVYRGEKPVLAANVYPSPTGKVLAYEKDGEYRLLALDGGEDVYLDSAVAIDWVTDDIILVLIDEKWQAYNSSGTPVNTGMVNLKFLGDVDDSTILFKDSKDLYKSVDGTIVKVLDAVNDIDNAVCTPDLYSIIAGDREKNALYLISGSVYTLIGQYDSLLKSNSKNGIKIDFNKSVKISPDGKTFTIAQLGKESVKLKIGGTDGSWVKEVYLDSNAYMRIMYDSTNLDFVNDNKIIFNDENHIWLIDFANKDIKVTRLPVENKDIHVMGIMIKK